MTRVDAASDFFGESHVPRRAITMGVATILASRRIIMMAFGGRRGRLEAVQVQLERPTLQPVWAQPAQSQRH